VESTSHAYTALSTVVLALRSGASTGFTGLSVEG